MPASALLAAVSAASLNLCTDEYLLLLAKPNEVASVSHLARDPLESPLWRAARRHHANNGSIEQVAGRRPDLLLTMGGGGRATRAIARRLGMRSLELAPASSIAGVADNLRRVAAALGAPKRAAPLLARLERLQRSTLPRARDAIWLSGDGLSLSAGTVGVEWMRLAGLAQRPLPGGRATLEVLLTRPPAVLVESDYRRSQVSRATRWLDHPVVRGLRSKRVTTDGRAWTCMGPLMIDEVERIRGRL